MNTLNYFLEANICLWIVALLYQWLLSNETSFSFLRAFLLWAVAASLLLPLVHFDYVLKSVPTLYDWMPTQLLPELVIGNPSHSTQGNAASTWTLWQIGSSAYLLITFVLLVRFLLKVVMLVRWIKSSPFKRIENYSLIESDKNRSSFSFFNFIFIGNASQFSQDEKDQVIQHELVHVLSFHSADILFIELVQLLFWFNPAIYSIKKHLKDVHEYQADSKVAAQTDSNSYSILMARMALLSVDFSIANHFNQSQTLKRIAMINAVKRKVSRMKLILVFLIAITLFITIACQDQLMEDAMNMTKNSTMVVDVPEEVNSKLNLLKQRFPDSEFAVIELNDEGKESARKLEEKLADQKKSVNQLMIGINELTAKNELIIRNFLIFEYTDQASRLAELSATDEVFTIVDIPAVPIFGLDQFFKQIGQSLHYPESARLEGKQGRVFVQFVVNKDGSLSDFNVVKGFDEECDAAAMSALMLSQKWYPAKQKGKIVKQKLVLPITFKL
jgi:TonB family protein